MIISSHIEGRIRVRDPRLRQPRVIEVLQEKLLGRPDVQEVSSNPKVGSLLVLFQHARNSFQEITDFLAQFLGPAFPPTGDVPSPMVRKPASAGRPLLPRRRVVNLGMLAALLVTLLAMAGSKSLHFVAGLHFLGFLAMHLFEKRRTLLA